MARISLEIDEKACAEVMRRYGIKTKKEAINFALRILAGERLSSEEISFFQGIGWDGDLDEMRSARTS